MGRPQNVEGVRKLVTLRYRYLVYYMIDDGADEIVILTIQHPAPSWIPGRLIFTENR